MFTSYSLQRNKPKTVVLIHGLFATSGFWIPALKCFPQHRILLVNVDYEAYLRNEDSVARLGAFLRQPELALDQSVELVGHSFGSVLVATVNVRAERRFHVCPIFLAADAHHDDLVVELRQRLGDDAPPRETALLMMRSALQRAHEVEIHQVAARGDHCLVPDSDRFFSYRDGPAGMSRSVYRGDHFEAAEPLSPFFQA